MGNKKIALVTGASSGMGREFVLQIHKRYPNLEEIWAVARNTKALEQLRKKVPKLRICAWNLTSPQDLQRFQELLEKERPQIKILVNSAGMGIQKTVEETGLEDLWNTVQLNCTVILIAPMGARFFVFPAEQLLSRSLDLPRMLRPSLMF